MRIAICDDEKEAIEKLRTALLGYDGSLVLDSYSSAAGLLSGAAIQRWDAAFIDIEMPSAPNGFDAARQLAEQPSCPLIVFVTHTEAYAVRGYGTAFRYIVKPFTAETIADTMRAIEAALSERRVTLCVDGASLTLDVSEILYAEVFNHTVVLHAVDGSYTFRSTIREFGMQLPKRCFAAPHQSYVVNLMHVRSAGQQAVVMTDGTQIPISRRKRAEFMHCFHNCLGALPC